MLPERMENGKLPAYAFPGGYPLYYLDKQASILCADCASTNDEDYPECPLVGCDINYEDKDLYCYECNARIEAAYAEGE